MKKVNVEKTKQVRGGFVGALVTLVGIVIAASVSCEGSSSAS